MAYTWPRLSGNTTKAIRLMNIYFIAPVGKTRPRGTDRRLFIEEIFFHVSQRTIDRYLVLQKFRMPGLRRDVATSPVKTTKKDIIRTSQKLLVRIDTTMPERIDISKECHHSRHEKFYSLTRKQFEQIKPFILKVEDDKPLPSLPGPGNEV